jgi:hypothetical protein
MTEPAEVFAQNARLEMSVGHWVRRQVVAGLETWNADDDDADEVAVGGILALEVYLDSEALNDMLSRPLFVPVVIHHAKGAAPALAAAQALAAAMNAATYFKDGRRHSSVYMVAHVLAMHGLAVDMSDVSAWVPFKVARLGKIGLCIALNLRALGVAPDQSDLAVVRLRPLSSDQKKAVDSDAALRHPSLAHLKLMPFGHILGDNASMGLHVRRFLVDALLGDHVYLGAAKRAYHFALKSARAHVLESATLRHVLDADAVDRLQAYKQTASKPWVDAMHRAVRKVAEASRDVEKAELDLTKNPGRFAVERDWLLHVLTHEQKPTPTQKQKQTQTLTTEQRTRFRSLLHTYTAQSSKFNVACLVAGLVPELRDQLLAQRFPPAYFEGTFGQYLEALSAAFAALVALRSSRFAGKRFKDLFVFRAVDLFELGATNPVRTVYNATLPFSIHNATFCSTSTTTHTARAFLKDASPCCLLKIRVPWTYHDCLALGEGVSLYPSERELLFPPGSAFVVRERRYVRDASDRQTLLLLCDVGRPTGPHAGGGAMVDVSAGRALLPPASPACRCGDNPLPALLAQRAHHHVKSTRGQKRPQKR